MLEKPIQRHVGFRERDEPDAPFVLVFTAFPGPKRRKRWRGRGFLRLAVSLGFYGSFEGGGSAESLKSEEFGNYATDQSKWHLF